MQFYRPAPPLANYIFALWYVNTEVPYQRERILPMTTIELMINFGAPHLTYDINNETRFTTRHDNWIAGLHTHHILNEPVAETKILGVRFKPGGAYPFFNGMPLSDLRNQVVDLDLIWGREAQQLRQQLGALPTIHGRFQCLEAFLMRKLCQNDEPQPDALVGHVIGRLNSATEPKTIHALSRQAGVSHKHLISQFSKVVGLTPKQFARISRLQHALAEIDPRQPINWGDIAYRCWYYDQAHFSRDFKAFSGLSPSSYLDQRRQIFGNTLAPGESVHFVPFG